MWSAWGADGRSKSSLQSGRSSPGPGAPYRRLRLSCSGASQAGMDAAQSPLERSGHTAFIHNNTLHVWGGYQVAAGQDVVLPSDEAWLCDLDSGLWEQRGMTGDVPPHLSSFCGAHINTELYIFGGYEAAGYSNQMFSVDLSEPCCTWRKVTDTTGTTPSPRNKHSCWVHRRRLIYFGGYGCKTVSELQNTSPSRFVLEDMSWSRAENEVTLFKGWNSEVCVFDTLTATWSMPETLGAAPSPRGCHASALLGSRGYMSGGVEAAELDLFCLDLDTWTWSKLDVAPALAPVGRSWPSMTPTAAHTLFMYGGFSTKGETLNDAWQFNTQTREWAEVTHPHRDKPRVFHSACLGRDSDVVVFGGSSSLCIIVDSMAVLRLPSPHHCKDVLLFQTQPYALSRLCEDLVGRSSELFRMQLSWLPSKLRRKLEKRMKFFSAGS